MTDKLRRLFDDDLVIAVPQALLGMWVSFERAPARL
jgi:hypothetical protein